MDQINQVESPDRPMPRRITSSDGELLSLLGAAVRLKIASRDTLGAYFVCEGRLPPGSFVPLHYHADVEVFLLLKGTLEILQIKGANPEAFSIEAGEIAFIPSNAAHGFRNTSGVDAQLLIIGGPRIESFFLEAGTPESEPKLRETGEPDPSDLMRMLEVAKRHGQTFLGAP